MMRVPMGNSFLTSSTQPQIWSIHVVVRTRTAKKCTKTPWKLKKRLPLITTICPPSKTNGALLNFAPQTNKFAVIK